MSKSIMNKNLKVLLSVFVLLSSVFMLSANKLSINAAPLFTLSATPTPRVEVTFDAGSTANVATATDFVAAYGNASVSRIVMTAPITLSTANVTSIRGATLSRNLQIDGNGFKLTHSSGDVFTLSAATSTKTFHLKNVIIEKSAGANASNLVSGGNDFWDVLFEDITINTGLDYFHIILGTGTLNIFFRGTNEFMNHIDDFAEGIDLVVFEDNSVFTMNEPGIGGTNFWNSPNSGTAVVHFGEYSNVDIKGNSTWAIFLYFKDYYIHRNADVRLYKNDGDGVITSQAYPSTIKIDSGAKFVLDNLIGTAYNDHGYKVEILANIGAHVEFIGKRADAGGGVRLANPNSKLIIDSPKYFNIQNTTTTQAAFLSGSDTNQALQLLNTDIGAWNKGLPTVAPTTPFPFNGVNLYAGNTTALAGTSAAISSMWKTSDYYRIAKSTRPTVSTTNFSLGLSRTNGIVSTFTPNDATLTYSSSNNGIASVDANGVVTGVSAGTATITVTATNAESVSTSTTMTVTVTNTPPTLTAPGFTQIALNSAFNALTGVSANDVEDGPITNIQVTGTVDPAVAGVYPITYSVTDSNNNTTTVNRVVLVNDSTFTVGTNYILRASNFNKAIDLVNTTDASVIVDAQAKLYDKATGTLSATPVTVTSIGGYNATEGTYNITFSVASEPTLTRTIQATVSASIQKTAANAELDAKADELRAAIDALPGISDSQKLTAKTAITNQLNIAKANVEAATTISSITAAKDAGIVAMTQVFDAQKALSDQTILNAKNSLDQKATDLKAAIDALPGLTEQQKIDAKLAIDGELATAKANVDAATILTGISAALTSGEAAMTTIYNNYKAISDQAIADAKAAAIEELNQKATAIKAAINNVVGATQAQKDDARAEIDLILATGISGVNSATTFAGITAVKDPSLLAMDDVLATLESRVNDALAAAKDTAIDTLDARLAEAKAAINALTHLSGAEKAAAIQALDDEYVSAKAAINSSTTTSEITSALNSGTRAFDAIVANATLLDAKNLAVTTLQAKAVEIKAAIDALPGLTAQQKADGKAAIDAELLIGTGNIQAATTSTLVQGALNISIATMEQIYVDLAETSAQALADAKVAAIAELTQKASEAKALIDALTNLTPTQIADAKAAIDADLATATSAVNSATDLVGVATELNKGTLAFEETVNEAKLQDLKNAAIEELNTKAQAAVDAIDALTNLSDAEKNAAKAAIASELTEAINLVNTSTTAIEIEDHVIDAQDTFDLEVQKAVLLNEKIRAKAELEAKAATINAAIDALPGLTTEQRNAAKADIASELADGLAAIEAGTRVGEVLSALDASKLAMDAIFANVSALSAQVLATAKSDAIAELQLAATNARNAIDALTNLSIEEKNAAKSDVTSDLNAAITAVNAATTPELVTTEKTSGITAINENVTTAQLLDAQTRSIAELGSRANQVKAAIDALVGLSDEDKAAAKLAVDEAKTAGVLAVIEASTIADVTTAQVAGDTAIDKILSDLQARLAQELTEAKLAAITELQTKATQAATAIDALTNLSAEEKQAAKDAITTALNNATTAVNSATSVAAVTTAKTSGLTAMDSIVNEAILDDDKLAAIAELQAKADEVKAAIDALPGLTTQQIIDGKAAIDAELSSGTANINAATNLTDVQTKLDASIAVMEGILDDLVVINNETLANDKATAIQELNTAAQAAKEAIDALSNLSAEEKATAKSAVDAELATAITAITAATTPTAISDAKNLGLVAIQQELVAAQLIDAKNGAIAELEQKAAEAITAINSLLNLTDAEREAALEQIANQKAAAIIAVNEAAILSRVIDARNNGVGAFAQTVLEEQILDAKNAATEALEAKAQEVIDAINALPGLTAAEKLAGVQAINDELTSGLAAIAAATTIATVDTAYDTSADAMDAILANLEGQSDTAIADAKTAAITELNSAAQAAKAAIDALTNLSAQEKTDAKNAIDTQLATAITAVENATTLTGIETALEDGKTAITQVVTSATLADSKITAKADLEAKAAEVIAAINALPGLTAAEKAAGVQAINDELALGLAAINAGTTLAEVGSAFDTSAATMDTIFANLEGNSDTAIENAKTVAITELNSAAQAAKNAIDALVNLTPEEKTAAKNAVDTQLASAIAVIESATTFAGVTDAKTAGLAAINQVVVDATLLDAKNDAIASLTAKAAAATTAINALTHLTQAERDAALAEVASELAIATADVNNSTTLLEVADALNAGNAAIDAKLAAAVLVDAKAAAAAALNQKALDVIAAINALPGLSPTEKAAGVQAINDELALGLAAINAGTTPALVNTALTTSSATMDQILVNLVSTSNQVIENARNAAIADLEQKAIDAKAAIDALPDLTAAEKQAAKAAVDSALETAITNVNAATTPTEIGTALNAGNNAIDAIVDDAELLNAQNAAKAELEAKATAVKAAIDALTGLSNAEKAAGKALIDAELANGLAAIEASTTITDVRAAVTSSKAEMDNILFELTNTSNKVVEDAIQAALDELDANAAIARAIINALPALSDQERATALAKVDSELALAKQAVSTSTSPTAVGEALNAGNASIAQVAVDAQVLDAKNASKAALEQKAIDVKAAIDALPGLTDEEKETGKALIDAELATGLAAIEAGTTVLGVKAAETTSRGEMDEIFTSLSGTSEAVVDAAQTAAIAELTRNADEAKNIINALTNLTPAEKAAALANVDNELAAAILAVNDALTPSQVATALNAGNASIAQVVVDAQILDAKNAEKAALEQKAIDVKAAIDALPGLTDEEKAAGKALIDTELATGLAAIEAGTSVLEVRAAGTTSRAAMDQVLSDLLDQSNAIVRDAKDEAIAELEQKAIDAKLAIDAMTDLTQAQRDAAKNAVDVALGAAITQVEESQTLIAIGEALNDGNSSIDDIVASAELLNAKNAAKAALNAKANDVIAAINALPGLTDAEKQAGIAAINAELQNGLAAIEAGTSITGVNASLVTSKAAMDEVLSSLSALSENVIRNAKEAAIVDLEQKANDAINEIRNLPNLTDLEKEAAIKAIEDKLQIAKDDVMNSTNPTDIGTALNDGKASIDDVLNATILLDAKNGAKAVLEAKADEIKKAIDAMPGLTDEQKAAGKKLIDEELARGIAAVDAGTTVAEVTAATNTAKAAMASVLYAPVIVAPTLTEVSINEVVDLLSEVSAYDLQDGDLTSKISVQGNVDTSKAGIYTVTYTVADSNGNVASATRVFLVNDGSYVVDNYLIITAEDFKLYDDEVNKSDADYIQLANVRVYDIMNQTWITNPVIKVDRTKVLSQSGVYEVRFTYNPSIVVKLTVVQRADLPGTGNDSTFLGASIALTGIGFALVLAEKKRKTVRK